MKLPVTLDGSEMIIGPQGWTSASECIGVKNLKLSAPCSSRTQGGGNSFKLDQLGGIYRVDDLSALQVGFACGPCIRVPLQSLSPRLFLGSTESPQSRLARSHPPAKIRDPKPHHSFAKKDELA